MQTDPQSEDESKAQRVRRMMSSFKVLNARIARLALGLGVSLKSDADVAGLMKQHQMSGAPHEHLFTPDRMDNQWKELRGLLVLRYGVLTSYVDQVGLSVTRKILVEAEHDLLLRGFNLGDDGISLKFLFNKP
jgi:hypothetical protein